MHAMQRELNNLTKTVARLLQVNTLMERPQTLPANLETVLTQLQFLPRSSPGQWSTSQNQPTMQQSYQRRRAALDGHRGEYERQHGPAGKNRRPSRK